MKKLDDILPAAVGLLIAFLVLTGNLIPALKTVILWATIALGWALNTLEKIRVFGVF